MISFLRENKSDVIRLAVMSLAVILSWSGLWKLFLPFDAVALGTTLIGGFPMLQEAYRSVRERRMTMELSMFLAVTATLAIGQFSTGLVITTFVMFAEMLEHHTVERGRSMIKTLVDILPRTITILRDGVDFEIDAADLTLEHIVVVKPGARIPVDGTVVKGISTVDQSSITGEPLPAEKSAGSSVFAGSINHLGVLEVQPERIGKNTTFGRIMEVIERAEQSKAPIQKIADTLAARLVYLAFGAAILTFLVSHNVVSAISALVVAGACGVAAGTPLAILAGIGRTAKEGIIVKGGVYIEKLGKVDTVVLDKTGTLTLGIPRVIRIHAVNGASCERVLALAAIAEKRSEHPYGRAIVIKAAEENIAVGPSSDVRYLPGQGIICHANGDEIAVGNATLMRAKSILVDTTNAEAGLNENSADRSSVFVSTNGRMVGVIEFADVLRGEAIQAVKEFKQAGCRLILLTGDSRNAADNTARTLGVDEVFADMLPEQKLDKIRELNREGNTVAMIGDGINDAPALIEASVGIAMGSGTEIALECADMSLTTNNLMKVVSALRISRQCLRVIFFNFWGTIAVDTVGVTLAFFGYLTPLLAASIHVVSELGFILNSARLLRR